ncbi:polyisoprenoid-binding protein [Helicobacter monodelphidis]|uniref:YceI family protein n=1 Tax=Helicobacter sp. 15-1451 TaxID=2004995 RepID=UPI000DCC4B7E|nr:YceI family protein [Helicobacter sp. 15-1451]RAX56748.1 polyisoprenoid-binding protein [Helicobacter sp. 15-1451]
MKKMCLATLLAMSVTALNAAPYTLDTANSAVKFSVSHLKLTQVDGTFKEIAGKIDYEGDKLQILEGSVAIKSIDTANEKRDAHLNAPDMFDSAKHPSINFKMTKFEAGKIYGDLTIKTTTKPIVLDAKVNATGNNLGIEATTKIKRSDFGITWDSVFKDNAVGDEVTINLNLKATKA